MQVFALMATLKENVATVEDHASAYMEKERPHVQSAMVLLSVSMELRSIVANHAEVMVFVNMENIELSVNHVAVHRYAHMVKSAISAVIVEVQHTVLMESKRNTVANAMGVVCVSMVR